MADLVRSLLGVRTAQRPGWTAPWSERGRTEQARARLEAALALFRRLGAGKDVEMIEQALTSSSTA